MDYWRNISIVSTIIVGIIIILFYKKDRLFLILIIIILLLSNIILLKDYTYTKTNHNVATWQIFDLTRQSFNELEKLEEDEIDNEKYREIMSQIRYSVNLLELNLRNSNFSKKSINKSEFYNLVYRIKRIINFISFENILEKEDIQEIIEIGRILNNVKGGFGDNSIIGYGRTIIIMSEKFKYELEKKIKELEQKYSINQSKN